MQPVRVGVIGLGRFGALHAKVWAQLPHVELVGLCSRSEDRCREVASACGHPVCYSDPEVLLEADLDAVAIVTDVERHTPIALEAMRQGKHVFCEILVTPDLEETDQLIEIAQQNEMLFMPGFLERFDVRRAEAKRRVSEGEMGPLVSLYGRRNIWRGVLDEPRFRPYPLILQPGIHTIDQLLWLADEQVTEVYARSRSLVEVDRPDAWWVMLTFESGLVGVIEQSWFVPDQRLYWSDVHLEIVGTKGTAHIREPSDAGWIWTGEAVEAPDAFLAPQVHGRITGALEAELAHFADCVAGGRTPLCTLEDARASLAVGLAVVESARTGQALTMR
ncbi:MAG: Gfo/Idh/MocA family oxidoreductase [Candidatus Latescibacteria bacterium]|nr:Gfo/Idh/MocA family oxidoreductase [Candidatus Latescibacterota bacterium]MEE3042412.1 Gfo/Idh/MocA family oxidoreductase [Candidatus Latescibacterota bacterium]